ncbi:MAG: Flp pilus assembly complex ATPase component TadA [Planctomycetes bacterium]|nr:Flp pilus assembly complex ATPase component TadA [Planctomycetota bacterium]
MAVKNHLRLGERLINAGILTEDQLDLALKEQKRTSELLGMVLVGLGFLTQDAVASALAAEAGAHHIELKSCPAVEQEALELVPESFARQYILIPLSIKNGRLVVAMENVFDVVIIDELQRMTNCAVEAVSAVETDILMAIDRFYTGNEVARCIGITKGTNDLLEESIRLAEDESRVQSPESGVKAYDARLKTPDSRLSRLVDQLITLGLKENATDIHIEPEEKLLRVRYRIDGVLRSGPSLPKGLQSAITIRIKIMSNMNISESRLPQDGRTKFNIGRREIDLRVSTYPTVWGENLALRILQKEKLVLGLEHLGLSLDNLILFRKVIENPHGIILVTGPTGSGKTTTLYSTLSYLNSLSRNIITIEDPVEYRLPIIRQSQINVKAGLTFPVGLRAILRHDPDVILVGEIRDYETAEVAVRAALTGHLVFSTLHTNDAMGAIPRLLDMKVESFLLAASLIAVIAQRLVRVICNNCKMPTTPDDALLKEIGWTDRANNALFYKGKGCGNCGRTGYKGRIGIFELLVVTPEVKELIAKRADTDKIKMAVSVQGTKTLREDGFEKVRGGITTLEEVLRVTSR